MKIFRSYWLGRELNAQDPLVFQQTGLSENKKYVANYGIMHKPEFVRRLVNQSFQPYHISLGIMEEVK